MGCAAGDSEFPTLDERGKHVQRVDGLGDGGRGRALWVLVVLMWAVVASVILVLALSWREKWAPTIRRRT